MFLSFAPNKSPKIAYAASFGKETLDEWEIKETKKLLDRYKMISVRELSGINILNELNIHNCECVLDPTLLLTGKEWHELSSKRFSKEKYILVYNLNRKAKIHNYARNLSKKTGLRIKYITYQLHECFKKGKMYCNTSVENYLSLIENAQYIVTDSFHGVAFSINFNKEFMVLYPNKFSSRLKSILKVTNVENTVAKDENDIERLLKKIDYKRVNDIIKKERDKSIKVLTKSLEG